MPPKKKSPLDAIRANQARTRATQAYVSGSAFTRLEEQNEKLALPKKTADASTPVHNWKSEPEPTNKVTKPPPPKKKKRKPSLVQKTPIKERKKQIFEDEEVEIESWVPAGGFSSLESITVKSKSIGVARIPGWRVEKFTKQLGKMLFMEVVDDAEDFKILVKTEDEALEKLTDIYVEFESLARAEELRAKIAGKVLGGRVLKVGV